MVESTFLFVIAVTFFYVFVGGSASIVTKKKGMDLSQVMSFVILTSTGIVFLIMALISIPTLTYAVTVFVDFGIGIYCILKNKNKYWLAALLAITTIIALIIAL